MRFNPFYQDIQLDLPEDPDSELLPNAGEFDDVDMRHVSHLTSLNNEPQLRPDALTRAVSLNSHREVQQQCDRQQLQLKQQQLKQQQQQ